MLAPEVLVFSDLEALSHATAKQVVRVVEKTLDKQDRCTLVLSGGSTPRRLYELLAGPYQTSMDWTRIYLFWGDERFVPQDHPKSNYHMAREAMMDSF